MRGSGIRPTIKVLLYTGDCVRVFHSPKRKINFPGGGIDEGELPALGLLREIHEEVIGIRISRICVEKAPILAYGTVPTQRDGFISKGLFLVACRCNCLDAVVPKNGELIDPRTYTLYEAVQYIRGNENTKSGVASLYIEALQCLEADAT